MSEVEKMFYRCSVCGETDWLTIMCDLCNCYIHENCSRNSKQDKKHECTGCVVQDVYNAPTPAHNAPLMKEVIEYLKDEIDAPSYESNWNNDAVQNTADAAQALLDKIREKR